MRRRVLPLLLALLAVGFAAWRRAQRRSEALPGPATGTIEPAQPRPAPVLGPAEPHAAPAPAAAASTADDAVAEAELAAGEPAAERRYVAEASDAPAEAEMAAGVADRELASQGQVERESAPSTRHNASTDNDALEEDPAEPVDQPTIEFSIPRFLSVPWALKGTEPGPEATSFRISFPLTRATRLDRIDVRETASQVFVTVLVQRDDAPAPVGGARRIDNEATVRLAAPLGTRALVHAPHDDEDPATDA